jgi:type I restriction enzyme M protein
MSFADQNLSNRLVIQYLAELGYLYMASEVAVPLGNRLYQADVVVFQDEKRSQPLIVAEIRESIGDEPYLLNPGVQQAFAIATALGDHVRYLLVTDGIHHNWFERNTDRQSLIRIESAPVATQSGKTRFRLPLIPVTSADQFLNLFQTAAQILRKESSVFSFRLAADLNRILLAKLYDERQALAGAALQFKGSDNNIQKAASIIQNLCEAAFQELGSPTPEPSWLVPSSALYRVAALLEPYYFGSVSRETRDRLFWEIFPKLLPKDAAAHLTPPLLASLLVRLANPTSHEYILDPACGTGALLLEAYHRTAPAKGDSYIGDNLFGVEINSEVAALAKTNLALAQIPPHQIVAGDSLNEPSPFRALSPKGGFDVIVTNPPVGKVRHGLMAFDLELTANRSTPIEALFLERCWRLLKPGGRMAIAVPDTLLTAPTYMHVREWLLGTKSLRAVVGLSASVFDGAGYTGSASVLILHKGVAARPKECVLMIDLEPVGRDPMRVDNTQALSKYCDFIAAYLRGDFTAAEIPEEFAARLVEHRQLTAKRLDVRAGLGSNRMTIQTPFPTATLAEVVDIIGGRNFKNQVTAAADTALLLQAGAVREFYLDVQESPHISAHDYESLKKAKLQPKDVLVTTTGQYLGRAALVEGSLLPATASGAVTILRPKDRVIPEFLVAVLNSPIARRQIDSLQAASTAQPYIRRGDLGEVVIPVPPLARQAQIAEEVFRLRTEAHRLIERAKEMESQALSAVLDSLQSDDNA